MKIIVIAYFVIASAISAQAQTAAPKFELKATGFVGPDSTKSYAVIEVLKMSKADLYKKTLTYLNGYYKNPAAVLSTVDGESIIVNAVNADIRNEKLYFYRYLFYYNIKIEFKDSKIKFEPIIVGLKEIWSESSEPRKIYLSSNDSPNKSEVSCIYMTGNGKSVLFKPEIKQSIDNWLNGYVTGLTRYLDEKW